MTWFKPALLALAVAKSGATGRILKDAGVTPTGLNAAIKEAIERHKDTLVKDASTARLAQLDAAIRSLKKQAEEVFASVECKGIEIEPGVFSGCDAAKTGASDCPSCGGNQ